MADCAEEVCLVFCGRASLFCVLVLLSDYSCFFVKLAWMDVYSCGLARSDGVVCPLEVLVNLLKRI